MKTKTWMWILSATLVLCLGLSAFLMLPGGQASRAQVWSDGKLQYVLELSVDQEVTIRTELGTNTITVKDGAIAVTAADCPDHYCMDRGYCSGGAQIVCLPNRLVIKFLGEEEIDGVVG